MVDVTRYLLATGRMDLPFEIVEAIAKLLSAYELDEDSTEGDRSFRREAITVPKGNRSGVGA